MVRHCMPQKHTHHTAMIALRRVAPASVGFEPARVVRVPSAAMVVNSVSTSSTKASTFENASQEAGVVLAGRTALPVDC